MNAQPKQKLLKVTEFSAWADAYDGDETFELHEGVIVPSKIPHIASASTQAKAPERVGHANAKFAMTAAPMRHNMTVHGEAREIYHHRRGEGGTFISALSGETLALDPPGIEVSLSGIFEDE